MHRLDVLTGRPPGSLVARLDAPPDALPPLPGAVDAGTPGDVLRRRPDVIAAEQRLHAATARIGVATADLFPRFTLGGLVGTQAVGNDALFARDSETRLVTFGIDWSFLDVGRVRARIAASDASASGVLAQYEQTVLRALEETENALVRYGHARLEDAHLERSAVESARAAELARVRYDAGAADSARRARRGAFATAGSGRVRRRPNPQRHRARGPLPVAGRRLVAAGTATHSCRCGSLSGLRTATTHEGHRAGERAFPDR